MEKKNLEKKLTTWECPEKCLITKYPCKHLNTLLPQVDRGRITTRVLKDIQNELNLMRDSEETRAENNVKLRKLETRLKGMFKGTEAFRVDLIMDRYYSEMTLSEIATKYGYVSASVVQYLLKQTIDYLKSGGTPLIEKIRGNSE